MDSIELNNIEYFKFIYDKYFSMVYKISLLYLKNIVEAEDTVQEIFIKLFKEESKFVDEDHIKAWLITVTKNLCKDNIKSFWKSRRIDIEKLPELAAENVEEDLSFVLEILLSLPSKYKIVLYLYYYEDYTVKDISKILDIKESTIQTQLSRGRKLLEKKVRRKPSE